MAVCGSRSLFECSARRLVHVPFLACRVVAPSASWSSQVGPAYSCGGRSSASSCASARDGDRGVLNVGKHKRKSRFAALHIDRFQAEVVGDGVRGFATAVRERKWANDAPPENGMQERLSASDGPQSFASGKHKGKSFEEVMHSDPGYCAWVKDQAKKGEQLSPVFSEFLQFLDQHKGLSRGAANAARNHKPASANRSPDAPGQRTGHGGSHARRKPAATAQPEGAGLRIMLAGKHKGQTFADVFNKHPDYCEWVVNNALRGAEAPSKKWEESYLPFVAYVQDLWLQRELVVRGRRGCLAGKSFAFTGSPAQGSRFALEELVQFFGGAVAKSVTTGTDALVVCSNGQIGKEKIDKAHEFRLPIYSVDDLLDEVSQSVGSEDDVTFSRGHGPRTPPWKAARPEGGGSKQVE